MLSPHDVNLIITVKAVKVRKSGERSAVTVHHRPDTLGCDEHEFPCQVEIGGMGCTCNRSWTEGYCGGIERSFPFIMKR